MCGAATFSFITREGNAPAGTEDLGHSRLQTDRRISSLSVCLSVIGLDDLSFAAAWVRVRAAGLATGSLSIRNNNFGRPQLCRTSFFFFFFFFFLLLDR